MDFDVQARYQLLCRVGQTQSALSNAQELSAELNQLNKIINIDLPALARQGSPDHFADILRNLQQEFLRFRNFCAFPELSQKNIVGIGGRFSAGKSSFINALLGKKCLIVDVNPTTSLPTYLLHHSTTSINAINIFQQKIALSEEEFQSLTHDEQEKYGSHVSALLQSAHIQTPDFPWQNLAILDTPGYTKPETDEYSERTDAQIAYAQLNSTNYLIWLISADDGTITEDDIHFLASLNPNIPRLILLNKADKKTPDDIKQIVNLIRKTLADRNIPALDVIPVSARSKDQYPIQAIHQYLTAWNTRSPETTFASNFKQQFLQYNRYIGVEEHQTTLYLNLLNNILMLNDSNEFMHNIKQLKNQNQLKQKQLKNLKKQLHDLQNHFFKTITSINKKIGIELPESDEIKFIELNGECKLLDLLHELFNHIGQAENDFSYYWDELMFPNKKIEISNQYNEAENISNNLADLMPSHYIATSHLNIRNSYAILLAAVLQTNQSISTNQIQFFNLLLNSLELEKPLAYYLDAGKDLNTETLKENLLSLINNNEDINIYMFFILDSMILLRIAGSFTITQNRIISLIFNYFFIDTHTNKGTNLLESITLQCAKILHLSYYTSYIEKDFFHRVDPHIQNIRKKYYIKGLQNFFAFSK